MQIIQTWEGEHYGRDHGERSGRVVAGEHPGCLASFLGLNLALAGAGGLAVLAWRVRGARKEVRNG
jgi:hypothetical protein